jgi:CheY-specific phosphatase CheX
MPAGDADVWALTAAAGDVLETMFFTSSEPVDAPLRWASPPLAAQVNFSGHFSGRFEVQIEVRCARDLACNIMGQAGRDCTVNSEEDPVRFLLCELTNMLCGNTLSRLKPDKLFDLGPPQVVLPRGIAEFQSGGAERWVQTDCGLLRMNFRLQENM